MRSAATTLSSLIARLLLLVVITAATGVLVGLQFLPAAATLTDAVSTFERQVLDVPPLPAAEFQPENSFIYDASGAQLAEISFEQRRIPVVLDDIPQITISAVLATEDKDFFEHNGLNYSALVRAAIANTQAGEVTQGGSTITQQYVENAYLPVGERFDSIDDKITEAMWAIEIEQRLSKQEILEGYLNRIYLGNGVYGFGTAADYYFSKHVSELTLGESAMLAGMIRFPEGNNPVDNPVNARGRRNIVIDQMASDGIVTADQRDAAQAVTVISMLNVNEVDAFDYPFWVDWVTRLLVSEPAAEGLGTQLAALEAMGATDAERTQAVFQSGLRIHTSLDPELQDLAQAAIDKALPNPATDPLGAIVTVQPGTGAIMAMAVGP
ncbi:MAG: penicillin-binding protein 1A, partial [Glaciecola sp.]